MIEFDPSLIQPFDMATPQWQINIFGKVYNAPDGFTYDEMLSIENDTTLFFVLAKNRKERKYFDKKKVKSFVVKDSEYRDVQFYVMRKSDLDFFYLKNT